jgi:rhodanese-related sulfurtransferase
MLSVSGLVSADTVKGRIQYISKRANTIQLIPKGKPPVVVRFDQNTQFVNAPQGIKEMGEKTLIEVEYEPGKPASRITQIFFALPPGAEIGVEEMEAIVRGEEPYTLVDARPCKRFGGGHLPTASCIFAKELPDRLELLPKDKSQLLVFYCGGPTCPFTGQSIKIVMDAGYTNVRGFQGGMPVWKAAKKPLFASASHVAKNLNKHSVIIDARPVAESGKRHIETAVAMPAKEFKALTRQFIKEKRKVAILPGVSDKNAPIFLYGNTEDSKDALKAFLELKKWKYKKMAIIEGGFLGWVAAGLPTETGPAADRIVFERKLKKGAIPRKEFVELEKSRLNVALLDVRSPKEVAMGTLQGEGALAIPLDEVEAQLDRLPRDKEIVAYCSNGIRSEMVYRTLMSRGFAKVRFLNETVHIEPDGSYRFE